MGLRLVPGLYQGLSISLLDTLPSVLAELHRRLDIYTPMVNQHDSYVQGRHSASPSC